MSGNDDDVHEGEVQRPGTGLPVDGSAPSYVDGPKSFFRSAFWLGLRIEADRKLQEKHAKAWSARKEHARAWREFQEETIELRKAIDRGKDIEEILKADRDIRAEMRAEAQAARERAEFNLKLQRMRQERKLEEEGMLRSRKEEAPFGAERQKIREMINKPQALWDEYYKHEKEVINKRGGRDKLTAEDENELERARQCVATLLDTEQI